MELDLSNLDSQMFSAISETSERRYVYMCNMRTNVSRWSKNAVEYFGLPGEYMYDAGTIWEAHVHPDDRAVYCQQIDDIFSGRRQKHRFEYRARNKQGDYVTCTCIGAVLKGENGEPDIFAGTIENHGIMDNIDATTNLYNIYEFWNRIRLGSKRKEHAAVLEIGINKFSDVNDIYGYDMGNQVLKTLAETFLSMEVVRENGFVYRMDGARFAFYFRDKDQAWLEEFYTYLRKQIRTEQLLQDRPITITLSAGAVLFGENTDAHSVMTGLSYALSKSKHSLHGNLVFFDHTSIDDNRRNLELLERLRQSVLTGCKGFYLCYQPIIDAEKESLIGMEALIRWQDEKFGEIAPGIFIPWLEKDACFFELGNWILETALTESKELVEKNPRLVVNVNVAYPQLEKAGFIEALKEILVRTGFPPENLCIEITERCRLLEREYLARQVKEIKEMGISVALDDFGTGFSSLDVLSYLPVDTLKIDRGFVVGIAEKPVNQAIVRSVTQCANELGVKVCMEGIEDRALADFLKQYGAGSYQGYYFSRPVSIAELEKKYGV